MRVALYYFSGTGNTKKIVDKYQEEFQKNGWEVDTFKIEEYEIRNKNEYDTNRYDRHVYDKIGIAYPIHAFNAPSIVLDFARQLHTVEHKSMFILKTSGEPLTINHISSIQLIHILKKKGYQVENEYHYVMPYNIIFKHSNAMAYNMWSTAERIIPIDCKEIIQGKKVKLKKVFLGKGLAWIFRIEHFGARFNGKYYRVQNKRLSNTCIHCNQCINQCPVHNIAYENNQFIFGNRCLLCMRCVMHCPVDAISIGLLNKWKVNGQYDFEDKENHTQPKHKNWCKKSYQNYFKRCEDKIKEYKQEKKDSIEL